MATSRWTTTRTVFGRIAFRCGAGIPPASDRRLKACSTRRGRIIASLWPRLSEPESTSHGAARVSPTPAGSLSVHGA